MPRNIERALENWAQNSRKQGIPLTDTAIKEKARLFAATIGYSKSYVIANNTSWLENFKQKNGIAAGKRRRRASDSKILPSGFPQESLGFSLPTKPKMMSPHPADRTHATEGTESAVACRETPEPDIKKETDMDCSAWVYAVASAFSG